MDEADLARFVRYLRGRVAEHSRTGRASPATIEHHLQRLNLLLEEGTDVRRRARSTQAQLQITWRYYQDWCREENRRRPPDLVITEGRFRKRHLPLERYSDAEYDRLLERVEGSADPADQVIACLLVTGLRRRDVLGITRADFERSQRTLTHHEPYLVILQKGYEERQLHLAPVMVPPFERLSDAVRKTGSTTVAHYVMPQDERYWGAAANRVAYRLRQIGTEAGVSGRIHLHKIRRTVAHKVWDSTHDIYTVQAVLGHKSSATTETYLRGERGAHGARVLGDLLEKKR